MERDEGLGTGPVQTPGELSIRVLGPLEVRADGHDRTPTAPMARRVMSVLLLQANRPVPVFTLIDELWETEPPRLARKTIQTYIYHLRRALQDDGRPAGQERLQTRPNGYLLRLAPGELDLWDFEERVHRARTALAAGDPRRAAALLREALGLWRGDAFAGVDAGPLLAARLPQITDSWLSAVELRVEADLRLGGHRSLLGELQELTALHPLHEEFTAQLMLAAHRSGQRRAALDAFTRLRSNLVDELGIEPSDRLRRLQQDILNESPGLELPHEPVDLPAESPAPPPKDTRPQPAALSQLPPDTGDFVGRTEELACLADLVRPDGTPRTSPRVITLLGGPGTGKTALALRVAHALRNRYPDGQLYARLHDGHTDAPVDPAAALRSLLEEIAGTGAPVLRPAPGAGALDELSRRFRTWSAGRTLVLLLDDVASADQVRPLLPGGGTSTVLVTARSRLAGLEGATHMEIGPLRTTDGVRLVTSLIGEERAAREPEAVRRVVTLTGNLPLGVRAAGEKLAARRLWTVAHFAERLVDEAVRGEELRTGTYDATAWMVRALARLPGPLRQALVRLSRPGDTPMDFVGAQRLLGVSSRFAEYLIGDLVDHYLLVAEPRRDKGGLVFRVPELVRVALLDEQTTPVELKLLPGGSPDPVRRGPAGSVPATG
ncbi:AfsR/SARP family transcriptional regulator [Streptomyces acidicola]|uniref:AAA family ATPase n=1 Tax=Streptomyces acidicola TaxID=2596892 RepID=A0A5N8WRR9_9ACTN|nr:BTAD domain-containing putative transcriptional regulator [Streptomyces acidicola]MPY49947.1 AAA family ATPase [Streptomyces acidicola]